MEQLYDARTLKGILQDLVRSARDPRYIRVNGKPVFLIYRPLIIPDVAKVVAGFRTEALRRLGVDLHMVFVESMESMNEKANPIDYGFDAAVEFPPHGLAVPASDQREVFKTGWAGHRYDYEQTVQKAILRTGVNWKRYPSVFPLGTIRRANRCLGHRLIIAVQRSSSFMSRRRSRSADVSFLAVNALSS